MIMLVRPIFRIWVSDAFYVGWRFVPFLVISEVFSSLVTFMGSFYMVSKRNATVPVSICVGAVSNILLNLWLIPRYDAQGAAFATAVSYILAYIVRAADIRRLVPIRLRPLSTVFSVVLLSIQSVLLLSESQNYMMTQLILFLLVLLCNIFPVTRLAFAIIDKISKKGLARAE
jgi:O-antigen/teichoic acid export membrane protein